MANWFNDLARDLGGTIIVGGLALGYIWLCFKSPILGWISRNIVMLAWLLATLGVGIGLLWYQIFSHRGDGVWAGIACFVTAALLAIPWWFVAREFYPSHFPPSPMQRKLWT